MKKLVGKVTEEEKNEILSLFERRNGLNELAKILMVEHETLYENKDLQLKDILNKFHMFQN